MKHLPSHLRIVLAICVVALVASVALVVGTVNGLGACGAKTPCRMLVSAGGFQP